LWFHKEIILKKIIETTDVRKKPTKILKSVILVFEIFTSNKDKNF
jgi:hypothetical protein